MKPILSRTPGKLAKQIGDVLLLIDSKVVLGGTEEYNAALADGDCQVTQLFISIWRIQHILEFCARVFAADNGGDVDIFKMVNRCALLQGLSLERWMLINGTHIEARCVG
jgi:hypothetical protein